MSEVFTAVPVAMEAFTATHHATGATITSVAAADLEAMLSAAAVALGPIGAGYLAAYAPAQANNLAAAILLGQVHHGIGAATEASEATVVASDNAWA